MDSVTFKAMYDGLRSSCDKMLPFVDATDGKLDCPWLKWVTNDWDHPITPRGILIMQDWGQEGESLREATDLLDAHSSRSETSDPTLTKLFASEAWRTAIRKRSILVTNAVWGLRPLTKDAPNSMCGYLGAAVHKRAFLRWGKLAVQLSSREDQCDDFRILVAGEWARFDHKENRSGTSIKDYFSCWRQWASNYRGKVHGHEFPPELDDKMIDKCKGRVVFLSHPCSWNHRFESNPFASLDSVAVC